MSMAPTISNEEAGLALENVSVSFPIYHSGSQSLKKNILFRGSGGHMASDANHRIIVEALRNVSMQFRAGDPPGRCRAGRPECAGEIAGGRSSTNRCGCIALAMRLA